MLMTVLKGDLTIKQSKTLKTKDCFVSLPTKKNNDIIFLYYLLVKEVEI